VLGPAEAAGRAPGGGGVSAGTGEAMAAAFGLGVGPGDAVISLGASGSVCAVHDTALADTGHTVTAFADATGRHLPIVRTLNATRVLRGTAELLGCDLAALSELALRSTAGAHGLVFLPYLAGERTPELPHTAGTLTGLRRESMKPEHLARRPLIRWKAVGQGRPAAKMRHGIPAADRHSGGTAEKQGDLEIVHWRPHHSD
jgi:xylulokinase